DMEFWTGITSPFYYSLEVLFALSVWSYSNFPKRFGLGLGIGNPKIINNPVVYDKPFSNFKNAVNNLLDIVDIRKSQTDYDDFPPLAIGGMGTKMIQFAKQTADYLLLNSISLFDIERAIKSIQESSSDNKSHKIIPYGMMQILPENTEISLTVWNISKDIAKNSSNKILKNHGYSSKFISQIRELSWERSSQVPKGEILKIVNDFGITGTIDEVAEKFELLKKYKQEDLVDRIVLGWIHTHEQWDELKSLVNILK
ncbi:MAG: hypothetical protein ACTSQF_15030, partial [Candidatus Heimdallarchaeaceae archaeon]